MEIKTFQNSARLADAVSDEMINLLKVKPDALMVMASGHSPKMSCELFAEKMKISGLSGISFHFAGLDEWVGIPPQTPGSCYNDFQERLFGPLQMNKSNYHLFDGMSERLDDECRKMDDYIKARGGIDLMIVGLGMNGHIGFNEPGVDFNQLSHVVPLDEITATVGQQYFEKPMQLTHGITLGFRHLLQSKKVYLLANGSKKAEVVKRAIEGEVDRSFPASIMQQHTNGFILIDEAAAALLGS